MAGKAGAQRGISAKVLKHFLDNPGKYVRVEDMAYEFEATEQQVANSVTYLIRESKAPGLRSIQNGHVWVYEPEEDPDSVKWEVIRKGDDGTAMLQATDGTFWIAKQVQF